MKSFRSRGFTLLEVLIAVVVLSIGLLGLAALQVTSIRNNQSANYRTQATNLAYQFIDMAKAYRGAGGDSGQDPRNHPNVRRLAAGLQDFSDGGTLSSLATDCGGSSPDALRCDRARWFSALRTQLPGGRAKVTFLGPPSGQITVEICWTDDRTQDDLDATEDCDGASEGFGMKSIGPDGTTDWANNALWLRSRL